MLQRESSGFHTAVEIHYASIRGNRWAPALVSKILFAALLLRDQRFFHASDISLSLVYHFVAVLAS